MAATTNISRSTNGWGVLLHYLDLHRFPSG
jgi:hypothetical protein